MDLGIAGRTALVCASTSGLGEGIARALGAEGARVVVTGRRADRAAEIAAELPAAIGLGVDLVGPGAAQRMVEAAEEAFGPVDILVLNGPGPRPAHAVDITSADIDEAVGSLIRPQQKLVSLVLGGMRERGWGRILAVASSGVVAPLANLTLSNIGRAALGGYLKTLATEVAADGVTVNMLLPGRISTARTAAIERADAHRTGRTVAETHTQAAAAIPAGRYGTIEEFGAAGAFLCGAPASYITGTATRCDGGLIGSL